MLLPFVFCMSIQSNLGPTSQILFILIIFRKTEGVLHLPRWFLFLSINCARYVIDPGKDSINYWAESLLSFRHEKQMGRGDRKGIMIWNSSQCMESLEWWSKWAQLILLFQGMEWCGLKNMGWWHKGDLRGCRRRNWRI